MSSDQSADCALCYEAWEPAGGEPDRGSHRCSLRANHDGPHRCGVCRTEWPSLGQIKDPRDLLTDEQNAKLNDDLAEMQRQRRRAEAASRDIPLC